MHLPKAIKELGEFDVKLNLHAEIEAKLKVFIESEKPEELINDNGGKSVSSD